MSDQYNESVASHYSAYRPPLHQLILQRAELGSVTFPVGLDVGCGTGRSSLALADFCEQVFAIDPSQPMLDAATLHPAITYRKGSGEKIPVPDQSIDIVTFAGSLPYADLPKTGRELCRVCRSDSLVLQYDFEVLIDDLLGRFGIAERAPETHYNHAANFSGVSSLKERYVQRDRIEFVASPTDIAHLLLADQDRYEAFANLYKTPSPLIALAEDVAAINKDATLVANIFFSLYQPVH